jgi:hypothetical protein
MGDVIRSLLLAALAALMLAPAADAAPRTCRAKPHAAKCAKASRVGVHSVGGGLI